MPDAAPPHPAERSPRRNMHDGIASWCDCCTCEAEPHWARVGDEMGIDQSDHEPEWAAAVDAKAEAQRDPEKTGDRD